MRTDRKVYFTMNIDFETEQGSEIPAYDEFKEQIRNTVKVYYPDSHPHIGMNVHYSVWDQEDGE